MPSNEKIATALRVLGTAVARGELVASYPRGVIVYGHGLAPSELRWLVAALNDVDVVPLDRAGPKGEDREIVGWLLGRFLRIRIRKSRLAELHDILRAPAGAS